MEAIELKFDSEKVCTKLARDYLDKRNEYRSYRNHDSDKYVSNSFHHRIYFSIETDSPAKAMEPIEQNTYPIKLLDLLKKIEENVDLFCQLEYLLRNIPIKETKNVDLKLIAQSILYQSTYLDSYRTHISRIDVGDDTPLFNLGLFVHKLPDDDIVISCTQRTVAVCTLFVDLCREVGFGENVRLAIVQPCEKDRSVLSCLEATGGCVAVLSAAADVDSAVDTLLGVSDRYPWRLRGVLVQEAALERFERRVHERAGPEQKRFLFEHVDKKPPREGVVPVDGYRTATELAGLLRERAPLALSLWGGACEGGEGGEGAGAALVWRDGHGRFDGPPPLAAAVYAQCGRGPPARWDGEALRLRESWLALPPEARFSTLYGKFRELNALIGDAVDLAELRLRANCARAAAGDCAVTWEPAPLAFVAVGSAAEWPRLFDYVLKGGTALLREDYIPDSRPRNRTGSFTWRGTPVLEIGKSYFSETPMQIAKVTWTGVGPD